MTGMWVGLAVLVTLWVAGPAGYLLGHALGRTAGRRAVGREWGALCDELEADLDTAHAEIRKADQTIETLNRNIATAFDAGIVQGQVLQAERQENGL